MFVCLSLVLRCCVCVVCFCLRVVCDGCCLVFPSCVCRYMLDLTVCAAGCFRVLFNMCVFLFLRVVLLVVCFQVVCVCIWCI